MANNSSGVWGIEIGQTALKAMHCITKDGEVVIDAFDFIEYPKILSQPEADPKELVDDALKTLLERNEGVTGMVVISVPGQSGLAKFFKPPPVEVKKISDIVRYEARQQIPFDLDDVVWDYQLMPGCMVEDGFAAESEVGLFAMKREQAYRQLAPFDDVDIEVDQVQLAPIALYNMIAYDRLHERLEAPFYDSANPPPSVVLLSIGTDSSDLIVTNGFRIWQRSMPIGGNHFTRQLTRDLKMTYAKAEHLKRNVREAVDPKLVIQTMRPVFNDLETEIQRSIGFFRSIDKKAEISQMLITGNTVKMPGLSAYLGKNLGFDVDVLDRFNRLGGDDVMAIPSFRDNIPTFSVCYGLCLQGLGKAEVAGSLIPQEIKTQRMIRAKKPWTVAALSLLLMGMTLHYVFTEKSWATTHENLWSGAESAVATTTGYSSQQVSKDEELSNRLEYLNKLGVEVAGDARGRVKWLEIIKVVNDIVPRVDFPDGKILGPSALPYIERKDIQVSRMDTRFYEDLSKWFTDSVRQRYIEEVRSWARLTGNKTPEELEAEEGPTEEGWVFQLDCFHYYNDSAKISRIGSDHVRRLMTNAFLTGTVDVPVGSDANGEPIVETFTLEQYGISYPLMLNDNKPRPEVIANPDFDPALAITATSGGRNGEPMIGPDGKEIQPPTLLLQRLDFVFQFVWKERTMEERIAARTADEEAAKLAAEEMAAEKAEME